MLYSHNRILCSFLKHPQKQCNVYLSSGVRRSGLGCWFYYLRKPCEYFVYNFFIHKTRILLFTVKHLKQCLAESKYSISLSLSLSHWCMHMNFPVTQKKLSCLQEDNFSFYTFPSVFYIFSYVTHYSYFQNGSGNNRPVPNTLSKQKSRLHSSMNGMIIVIVFFNTHKCTHMQSLKGQM